jgi:hypothetical protein
MTDSSVNGGGNAASHSTTAVGDPAGVPFSPDLHRHTKTSSLSSFTPLPSTSNNDPNFQAKDEPEQTTDEEKAARSLQHFSTPRAEDQARGITMSNSASQGGQEEEAVVYSQTRMLQDPTGRLCKTPDLLATCAMAHAYSVYLGDSATLSFLQIVRMMVESVAGQSPFTTDPRRHKIMESQFSLPSNTRITQLLPDQRTALILVESFFIGVCLFSNLS